MFMSVCSVTHAGLDSSSGCGPSCSKHINHCFSTPSSLRQKKSLKFDFLGSHVLLQSCQILPHNINDFYLITAINIDDPYRTSATHLIWNMYKLGENEWDKQQGVSAW